MEVEEDPHQKSKESKAEDINKTTQEESKKTSQPLEESKKMTHEEQKAEAPVPSQELLEDFASLEIRVGMILECWKHPDLVNFYCKKIDIGHEVREICSELQKFVSLEDMSGLVIVLVNLKPGKLGGTDYSSHNSHKFKKKAFLRTVC